jgi:hypothetical protein
VATPTGARELASLCGTCRGLRAALSTDDAWGPFLQQLESTFEYSEYNGCHPLLPREEEGWEVPDYDGPDMHAPGRPATRGSDLVPWRRRDSAITDPRDSIARFVRCSEDDMSGAAPLVQLQRRFHRPHERPPNRNQDGSLAYDYVFRWDNVNSMRVPEDYTERRGSIWLEQPPPFRCPLCPGELEQGGCFECATANDFRDHCQHFRRGIVPTLQVA